MSYPRIDLEGATIAITGAARGIGLATAEAFERAPYVALGDLDEATGRAGRRRIGDHAMGHGLDVTDKASYTGRFSTRPPGGTARWTCW